MVSLDPVWLIKHARKDFRLASQYIESGKAVNYVPEKLRSSVLWSINAWLAGKGDPQACSDSQKMFFHFLEVAPKELSSAASCLLSDIAMTNGNDEMPWRGAKQRYLAMIPKAEDLINTIEKDLIVERG